MVRVATVAVVLAVLASGCAGDVPKADQAPVGSEFPLAPSEPFGRTTVTLRAGDGATVRVPAYDAFTGDTRQRGLMFRESLPQGTGMVFRMPSDRTGGFWMKDTLIPLSIAFFTSDGAVVDVLDMEPCPSEPCPSYPPGGAYRFALEVNQGYFSEIGLGSGWRIELPADLPAPS